MDNVVGPGSTYNDAYWEVSWIRTYTFNAAALPGPATVITSSGPTMQNVSSTSVQTTPATRTTTTTTQTTSAVLTPVAVSSALSNILPATAAIMGSSLVGVMLGYSML